MAIINASSLRYSIRAERAAAERSKNHNVQHSRRERLREVGDDVANVFNANLMLRGVCTCQYGKMGTPIEMV